MERALGSLEFLPECPGAMPLKIAQGQEADGLEWLLRLAIIWQQVTATPLRRTQQGDFFKRDLDRLQTDPLLSTPPIDSLIDLPDASLFTVAFALASGVLQEIDGEIRAATFPAVWNDGLSATVAALWSVLAKVESWNPVRGWQIPLTPGNPYPSAYLLSMLLLGRLPEGSWASPEALEDWVVERHPYWNAGQREGAKNGPGRRQNKTRIGNGAGTLSSGGSLSPAFAASCQGWRRQSASATF